MDLTDSLEMGAALSLPLPVRSSASSQGLEARSAVTSSPSEALVLHISSSEAGESEDLSLHSPACDELVGMITHAVAKLNIEWPADKQVPRQRSKLDEVFLLSHAQPPHQCLPFFPDLCTEVFRSWKRPVSYHVFSPQTSMYSNIHRLKHLGYGAMPRAEEMLASHLYPESASSLKVPALPTKPLRATSTLCQ